MKFFLLIMFVILATSRIYLFGETTSQASSDDLPLLVCGSVSIPSLDDPYKFNVADVIAPTLLIAAGATTFYIRGVNDFDTMTRREVGLGHGNLHFDDYLQYSPVVLAWGLDLAGVESRHRFKEQTTILALSALGMGLMVNGTKYTISRKRPDLSQNNSFPSGHTAMAFMGAEFLRMEFWNVSPWIGFAGYALAASTAYMRVYNTRHWATDTLAGAGIGILSVKIAYWLAPSVNRLLWGSDLRDESQLQTSITPYTNGEQYGLSLSLGF